MCPSRMRKNFLPFSSGARNDIYLQRSSKALPTTDTLDTKEAEFIQGWSGSMVSVVGCTVGLACGQGMCGWPWVCEGGSWGAAAGLHT